MLYFANRPDAVFTAILHDALEDLQRMLTVPVTDPAEAEDIWKAEYPTAAQSFPLALAVYTLDRLLAACKDPTTLYRLTDYHWLLLYDCLRSYCAVHNADAEESAEKLVPVGPYEIGAIDFPALVDEYFWDTDFLLDASTGAGLGPEGRQQMDISLEAFGISQKHVPHFEELTFEPLVPPPWRSEESGEESEERRILRYPPDDADD